MMVFCQPHCVGIINGLQNTEAVEADPQSLNRLCTDVSDVSTQNLQVYTSNYITQHNNTAKHLITAL